MAILFGPASFRVVRGTKWEDDVILTDQASGAAVNLTGIVGMVMRVRSSIASSATLLELSVANGRLVIVNAAAGRIGIRVGSALTKASFPANNHRRAKYVYDALIERTAGEYEAALSGKLTVLPQVSRPLDV